MPCGFWAFLGFFLKPESRFQETLSQSWTFLSTPQYRKQGFVSFGGWQSS
jgi:hypothetical protein